MSEPQFRKFRLSELKPADYNPRVISEVALLGLRHSLSRFGCVEPIVVNVRDGRNTIVGGHQRHMVLMELHGGDYECTCVVVDLSESEEKTLNITLNNPHIQGDFIEKIGEYIDQLRAELPDTEDYLKLRIDQLKDEIQEQTPNFSPTDEVPRLDQLEPIMIKCPHCHEEFNARNQM